MRKKIVAGNWKMNLSFSEAKSLLDSLKENVKDTVSNTVIVCPPFVYLEKAKEILSTSSVVVCSQDISSHSNGAFTGEVSAQMLSSLAIDTTIIGHSERREYHKETSETLKNKVENALENGLTPIYCVGEKLEDRKSEKHFQVIENQIKEVLFHLNETKLQTIILAYEPVWAIGTGETASPEQAQEIHAFIRDLIAQKYGEKVAQGISILYGGSVKPSNAKEIFAQTDVDGGLIGGASLKSEDFLAIVNTEIS